MRNGKLLTVALALFISLSPFGILQFNKVKASANQIQDVLRIGGADRFETSVEVAKHGWTNSKDIVIAEAEGDNDFADAITGTSLAYYLDCPILLTKINSTPDIVKDEINKLGVKNIYILGGTGVISKSQEDTFKANGYDTVRIAGVDRFDTACKAADILNSKSKVTKIYIASGYTFQYPLIAAPYAASESAVILFTDGKNLDSTTKNEIVKLGIKDISIVGSSGIVAYSVSEQLSDLGIKPFRVNGNTPQSIASNFVNISGIKNKGISIVSDKMFPDALSASILTAKNGYNMLLVGDEFNYTINNNVKHAFIFGGIGAVSDSIENYIKNLGNNKDISNNQIYQLLENSRLAEEDIILSVECKSSNDEKIPMPKQYDSYEKIKDFLSNYYTDDCLTTIMKDFSQLTTVDGKLVSPPGGNLGVSFSDGVWTLNSRENIDNNTIQVSYTRHDLDKIMDNISVTLSWTNNTWKISSLKYY
ncbi:cell wall-binding repeat-containing protein [Clostridium thailandense]|uniref:cell wall-binding repeat-containing protein n=1 Tax=Clostridium thailandense TaxID=2794346 RepID=UPI003989FDDB